MKNYELTNNKIIIYDLSQFNIEHILECGQVFLYEKKENYYEVLSGGEMARIFSYPNKVEIICTNTKYFENYFDLKTDYNEIKRALQIDETMRKAVSYGYGMRILRQHKLETLIGFIISANNNIKRIQKTMYGLCKEFGTKINHNIDTYYAFPNLQQLSKISKEEFLKLGAGYRADYLLKTIKYLSENNVDLEKLEELDIEKLNIFLLSLYGIGQKVADCILLFAYSKTEVVPVDTWVDKIYNKYYGANKNVKNRKQIREEFLNYFKKLSGYAQQYLFYYEREQNKVIKKL